LASTRGVGSVPTWVLSNHDVIRHATRYALPQEINARKWLLAGDRTIVDTKRGLRRARAAALLMLALPGSVYLYQGEELGLPEVYDLPVDVLDDPVWERSDHRDKGRDGCRVPIPWSVGGSSFGFGSGQSWLPQPSSWGANSVEAQDGASDSTLELYRGALRLRRQLQHGDESIEWLDYPGAVAFRRPGFLCFVNMGDGPVTIPPGEVLASSSHLSGRFLESDSAVWIRDVST
jgi:alpha-glucosidase